MRRDQWPFPLLLLHSGFWASQAGESLFELQELNKEAKTDRLMGLCGGQTSLAKTQPRQ